jgi:hypothetical protein
VPRVPVCRTGLALAWCRLQPSTNLLTDGTAITGVIDINPPVLAGDCAFDLVTLLFYSYDHD